MPTVLLIALFGALLIATIFEIATRFGRENILFRNTYGDQVEATGYIERAKGLLAHKIAEDEEAIHPVSGDAWDAGVIISGLDDLEVRLNSGGGNDPLIVDNVAIANGRTLSMRVYDLTYSAANVNPTLTEAELVKLPAPLELASLASVSSSTGFDGVGSTGEDPGSGSAGSSSAGFSLKDIGAYLVRVQIRDHDGKLARTTEQAFFILARDLSGGSGTP